MKEEVEESFKEAEKNLSEQQELIMKKVGILVKGIKDRSKDLERMKREQQQFAEITRENEQKLQHLTNQLSKMQSVMNESKIE